ncbi:MAG: hypothetical protein ACP5E4_01505 [Candidatus Aenigmatarchaeota archaeon]
MDKKSIGCGTAIAYIGGFCVDAAINFVHAATTHPYSTEISYNYMSYDAGGIFSGLICGATGVSFLYIGLKFIIGGLTSEYKK